MADKYLFTTCDPDARRETHVFLAFTTHLCQQGLVLSAGDCIQLVPLSHTCFLVWPFGTSEFPLRSIGCNSQSQWELRARMNADED